MSIYNLPTDKIPEHVREIILAMQETLASDAYDFLLIGATARDLIVDGQYNLGPGYTTRDVDFAIYVPEWSSYISLMDKLVKSGQFQITTIKHRVLYHGEIEVDIIPFGAIQDDCGTYTWPPDYMKGMNVAGFIEINDNGVLVESVDLSFRVAPIEGICIMKFFAWQDRKYKTDKDAKDLGFILANYLGLKSDLLYEKYEDIAVSEDFDTIISCARVLGRDIAEILLPNSKALDQIYGIIMEELIDEDHSMLARTMASGQAYNYDKAYASLKSILAGIDDLRVGH